MGNEEGVYASAGRFGAILVTVSEMSSKFKVGERERAVPRVD